MNKLTFLFLFAISLCHSQISFSERDIDLGTIKEAYEIKGGIVLKNTSAKKIFLMRADADNGVKIYTSKKTLLPEDTCQLLISFIPEKAGRFSKKISLVSSDKTTPYTLNLAGNLASIKTNDKTACYYFGSRRNNGVAINTNPILIPEDNTPRDNSNKMPENPAAPAIKLPPAPAPKPVIKPAPAIKQNPDEFSADNYRPNNILFLVDVSSSMRDSLKLPLMKNALHTLINAARSIDTITFITYALKVNVLKEAVSGADKRTLHALVDSLKARGLTSGNKAILTAQLLSQKHFINGGNNQVILATDGEFKFLPEDQALFISRQTPKKIILSTVAFGSEKAALKNLKDIAAKGEGSFIHIETRKGSGEKLLNEIKQRSRK